MNEIKGTLKPTLSEKVQGIIWKILLDEKNHLLAAESRDPGNKQVYFSIFDYAQGLTLLKNKTLPERWNLNIAHLTENSLLLKVFPDEGHPVSKGIIAIHCKTGNITWEKYNISYHNIWQEGLEVYNPDFLPVKSFLLDTETGDKIPDTSRSPVKSSVILPAPYDQRIIPDWLSHNEITGSVLYIKKNRKNFLAFHEQMVKGIQLRLLVYQDVEVLINDILMEGIQKLQPEAFFIVQDHLFCIKESNEVISYLV